jgi:hypothetical protein
MLKTLGQDIEVVPKWTQGYNEKKVYQILSDLLLSSKKCENCFFVLKHLQTYAIFLHQNLRK